MQRFSTIKEIELLNAGPVVGHALGADLPVKDLGVKGLGPVNIYNGDGEPAQLAVTFLL